MSIKPIDFQVMLPKTSEVSKIHNDVQHKNQMVQQQQATTIQHKAEQSLKQVNSQEDVQHTLIKEKQEKNQENPKDKKQKDKQQKEKKTGQNKTTTIDIRL